MAGGGKALCLWLALEGALLAASPGQVRALARLLLQLEDRTLRRYGLAAMAIGAGLLYVMKQ